VPPGAVVVWQAWLAVRAGTPGGEPAGWQAIEAWSRLSGRRLEPWEARMVRDLDDAFLEASEKARPKPGKPAPAGKG
jgi:hypothetical protein